LAKARLLANLRPTKNENSAGGSDEIGVDRWRSDCRRNGDPTAAAGAPEIRLAEQFSMGYLQFNVMKRDRKDMLFSEIGGLNGS
jgi:hypothetical protein